jgi:D-aminopeptidase
MLEPKRFLAAAVLMTAAFSGQGVASPADPDERPRARDLGIEVGVFEPGPLNAITDVKSVRVGHVTVIEGDEVRTGVTAILPHGGNLYQDKVPGAVEVGNGYGKLAGSTQVMELGEIETPIILTNTLNVAEGMIGAIEWTLARPGNEEVVSVNAVVGETNDSHVNDIRARKVTKAHVIEAIETASTGPVVEGSVGAGTGTHAFRWKGGIGTSSRQLPGSLGGYTVGVLVQTNFRGVLSIDGVPVGKQLDQYLFRDQLEGHEDGSIMIVVATDAPLSDHNLQRTARRALFGIARTGGPMPNGSGEYVIAFSTAKSVRRTPARRSTVSEIENLPNDRMTGIFQATVEATEEAIYNAILKATTVEGNGQSLQAIDIEAVQGLLAKYNRTKAR